MIIEHPWDNPSVMGEGSEYPNKAWGAGMVIPVSLEVWALSSHSSKFAPHSLSEVALLGAFLDHLKASKHFHMDKSVFSEEQQMLPSIHMIHPIRSFRI